jgi:hypothetical protein
MTLAARGVHMKIAGVLVPLPTPCLAGQRCRRCHHCKGVFVVGLWTDRLGQPREASWCSPRCATMDGWPWLTPAPAVPHAG